MSGSSRVLLLGGTAQVGVHVLGKLLEAGCNTIALSRKLHAPQQKIHPGGAKVLWLAASPDDYAEFRELMHEPDSLISTGPIRLAVECLERHARLRQVVCLSTSSVLIKADSNDPLERQQIEDILSAEQQLEAICSARDIGLVLLRPSLIYGCGMDENISRLAHFIGRFGFLPLAGAATGLRQPTHVADLAELIVRIATKGVAGQHTWVITGGSTLSYRDMAAAVFRALEKKQALVSLPPRLLAFCVSLARTRFGMKHLNEQMVLRQNLDLVFDSQPVCQRYDFQPREFQPVMADFSLPAELKSYLPD